MKNKVWLLLLIMISCSVSFVSCNKSDSVASPLGNWYDAGGASSEPREGAVSFTIGTDCYMGLGFYANAYESTGLLNDFWVYHTTTGVWEQVDNFAGKGRVFGASFAINGIGYVGLGKIPNTTDSTELWYGDFWSYNPALPAGQRWVRVADFPSTNVDSTERNNARRSGTISFAVNGLGYVGCGLGDGGAPQKDFYSYNPATNSWSTVAGYSGDPFYWGQSFVIGHKAYVCGGTFTNGGKTDRFFCF